MSPEKNSANCTATASANAGFVGGGKQRRADAPLVQPCRRRQRADSMRDWKPWCCFLDHQPRLNCHRLPGPAGARRSKCHWSLASAVTLRQRGPAGRCCTTLFASLRWCRALVDHAQAVRQRASAVSVERVMSERSRLEDCARPVPRPQRPACTRPARFAAPAGPPHQGPAKATANALGSAAQQQASRMHGRDRAGCAVSSGLGRDKRRRAAVKPLFKKMGPQRVGHRTHRQDARPLCLRPGRRLPQNQAAGDGLGDSQAV